MEKNVGGTNPSHSLVTWGGGWDVVELILRGHIFCSNNLAREKFSSSIFAKLPVLRLSLGNIVAASHLVVTAETIRSYTPTHPRSDAVAPMATDARANSGGFKCNFLKR